jgi:Undecaprenyl-phosphate glucose phosphotransferase
MAFTELDAQLRAVESRHPGAYGFASASRIDAKRYRLSLSFVPVLAAACDALALSSLAYGASFLARQSLGEGWPIASATALLITIYLVVGLLLSAFDVSRVMSPFRNSGIVAAALCVSFFALYGFFTLYGGAESVGFEALGFRNGPPYEWLLTFCVAAMPGLLVVRVALRQALAALHRRGVVGRHFVLLGDDDSTRTFLYAMKTQAPPLCAVAGAFRWPHVAERARSVDGVPFIGNLDALVETVRARPVEDVIVTDPDMENPRTLDALDRLRDVPVNVLCANLPHGGSNRVGPVPGVYRQLSLQYYIRKPLSGWRGALKRLSDYVLASIALIMLLPLFLAIAAAIRIESPGPILFRQERHGLNNRKFTIYKFRSMTHAACADTEVRQAVRDDKRVTRVGRFLRRTSLDELPQLLNVLDGSMSLVGPRPHALSHNVDYAARIDRYSARHRVRPGITGWAQVNGFRGETETLDKMIARVEHDIYYTENWSLLLDIKILCLTVIRCFAQDTAY